MALKKWVSKNKKSVTAFFLTMNRKLKMNNPWILCGIGALFCCSGVYLFYKNVYEDEQSVKWPVIIIILGVLLIAAGTAKYFKVIY